MRKVSRCLFAVSLLTGAAAVLTASEIPIGILSLDPLNASSATFDIVNQTGLNDSTFPDTTFPVETPLNLSNFTLTIDFQNGGVVTDGSSQFTSDGGGGFTGNFGLDLTSFPILSASLTGTLGPLTAQLNDGSTTSVAPDFTSQVLPSSGTTLAEGDFGIINVLQTPEPAFGVLCAGVLGALLFRSRGKEKANA